MAEASLNTKSTTTLSAKVNMAVSIAFVTFGMFIIDEIEFLNDPKPQQNLIGGAGVYAALGARLAAGCLHSQAVSWIVDIGSDFPENFKKSIDTWDTACIFRTDTTRLTTRAWNGYGENEHRDFKYLTPKIRLEVESLDDRQAMSSSFHMVCSPNRCLDLTTKLRARRAKLGPELDDPIVVWEPIPDLCTPEELGNLQTAATNVSIVSPNADELAAFFRSSTSKEIGNSLSQDEMVEIFMGWRSAENGVEQENQKGSNTTTNNSSIFNTHVVIREGANGSTIYVAPDAVKAGLPAEQPSTRKNNSSEHPNSLQDEPSSSKRRTSKIHLPAYHTPTTSHQVLDPTGGGNTFLGALAISMTTHLNDTDISKLITTKLPDLAIPPDPIKDTIMNSSETHQKPSQNELRNLTKASLNAVIAASYAIEQSGVPSLDQPTATPPEDKTREKWEEWNGQSFDDRMTMYLDREGTYLSEQIREVLREEMV